MDESGIHNGITTTSNLEISIANSELQQSPADPVIHYHYLLLGTDEIYGIKPWKDLILL